MIPKSKCYSCSWHQNKIEIALYSTTCLFSYSSNTFRLLSLCFPADFEQMIRSSVCCCEWWERTVLQIWVVCWQLLKEVYLQRLSQTIINIHKCWHLSFISNSVRVRGVWKAIKFLTKSIFRSPPPPPPPCTHSYTNNAHTHTHSLPHEISQSVFEAVKIVGMYFC